MTPLSPRQLKIVELARMQGRVDVDDLAESFNVTKQTIRRDLNELCDTGVLNRFHGGAVPPSGAVNVAYEARRRSAPDEKSAIGAVAANLVPDGASLLINIGTTTEQVAAALRQRQGLMVITNNINVANILQGHEDNEIIIAAGVLRHSDGGIVGEQTVEFIRQFKVDYAIIGASAIDADGSLLDYDYREVSVSRTIISSARKSILVADGSKFERTAPVRIGHLSDLDHFVTNSKPPTKIRKICEEANVGIHLPPRVARRASHQTGF
ncbi:MAG: DeoR/GlpR family DNA-binding transcription regulator [Pseudomonadota bacterium]